MSPLESKTSPEGASDCSASPGEAEDNEETIKLKNNNVPLSRVFVAPMVRGSERAFRSLVRQYAPDEGVVCFSPMLKAEEVIKAHNGTTDFEDLHKDNGQLFLKDIQRDTAHPLIVQLCGSCPDILADATRILIQQRNIIGVDLNLGCPQTCAKRDGFGAFLEHTTVLKCVAAMRAAMDAACNSHRVRLSCKIRLLDHPPDTIPFAQQLENEGCELLTVHLRRRTDKRHAVPDLQTGKQIVEALTIPVVINGPRWIDASTALQVTQAHGIMIARDFLRNPRLLSSLDPAPRPEVLAAEYLQFAQHYPPPSHLYIQLHLRWIFRDTLEPPMDANGEHYKTDWKPRLWTFIVRPFVDTWEQYAMVVVLYCLYSQCEVPTSLREYNTPEPTFNSIRHYHGYGRYQGEEEEVGMNLFG